MGVFTNHQEMANKGKAWSTVVQTVTHRHPCALWASRARDYKGRKKGGNDGLGRGKGEREPPSESETSSLPLMPQGRSLRAAV